MKKLHTMTLFCTVLVIVSFLLTGCGGKKSQTDSVKTKPDVSKSESAATTAPIETSVPVEVPEGAEVVPGKVYFFDKDNAYNFSKASGYSNANQNNTYGVFSICGSEEMIPDGSSNGVWAYKMSSGKISIRYNYSKKMMDLPAEDWQIDDDGNSQVDVFKLDKNVQKGAIILQKSMDHLNWFNLSVQTNAFVDTPVQNGVLYETTDIEMINGCYYRLLVVYKTKRKTGTSNVALIIPKDDYEFQRTAEVYEFYAAYDNEHIEELEASTNRYSLGEAVLAGDYASYSGEKKIENGDMHYGWNLGNFFVSGFTSKQINKDEVVFLKNVGDVVTLWFNLKQNINALNNDKDLTIEPDTDGYDSHFQSEKQYFGRGMLIIRYTDHENIKHKPVYYADYLRANTLMGTDTRVSLFEEGDYEVALDYEVKKNQLISQNHHYRIFFKFSVRNANCMVYPFDVATGEELTNKTVTTNGFYLDLAMSRYLDIYIKKEIWTQGAEGLTEDTRFNTAAKENYEYVDEGIYTITVKNKYTGLSTEKKIYVGTDRILMAHMNTGYSIPEIQKMIEQGAIIYEDGTIEMPVAIPTPTAESTEEPTAEPDSELTEIPVQESVTSEDSKNQSGKTNAVRKTEDTKDYENNNPGLTVLIAILALVVCGVVVFVWTGKKHKVSIDEKEKEEQE